MTVGENLKRIRKEKKLTQKQLGELCKPKISESTIRKYELGILNPKIETIRKIADALGVYISDLVDDWENIPQEEILSNLNEDILYKNSKQLLDKLQSMEKADGTLDEKLLEKELDSIIEITQKTASVNKAFYTAQIKQYMDKMLHLLLKLNTDGKEEALKRVSELTRLSEYMGVDLNILLEPHTKPADPPKD